MTQDPNELIATRVSLLNRLKHWEDHASWLDFFNTYWKLIYASAIRSGLNDSEAQDVVQETIVVVAKKMRDFRYDPAVDSFKGWLFYLTRKQIAMQFRRRARERGKRGGDSAPMNHAVGLEDIPDGGCSPEAIWEQEWERNLLEAALVRVKRQVSAKQYQMFDLYVDQQWPARQVAESMGVPVAQVYLAKHRVAALIKEEVKRLEKERR